MKERLERIKKLNIKMIVDDMFSFYGNPKVLNEKQIFNYLRDNFDIKTREEMLYFLFLSEKNKLGIHFFDANRKIMFQRMTKEEYEAFSKMEERMTRDSDKIYYFKEETGQFED